MQWNIELSADKPMIFFKADHTSAWLVRGACVVKHSALLKIKLIDQLGQKNWSSSLCLETISPLCFLCVTFWALFPCWRWSTERASSEANGCCRMHQTLLGSNSAASGAWLSCDVRSEPHYSSANPELLCWLQGWSWIMQNNQQQDVPWPRVGSGSDVSRGSCWQDGLCLLSSAPGWFHSLPRQPKADLMLAGEIRKCVISFIQPC